MIAIKYSKLNGAEFIPHLDTMRHFQKTIRRMDIPINYSKGFNPHMLVYMSAPIPLGLKSESEYCVFDTDYKCDDFIEKFNQNSPKGIRCKECYFTDKKPNVGADITSALYEITGINYFDVNEILNSSEFMVFDKRKGEEINSREKIKNLYFKGDKLYAHLDFGNVTLRSDYLINKLVELYGGNHPYAIKKESFFLDGISASEYFNK
jgi:radical SAM-linked protein